MGRHTLNTGDTGVLDWINRRKGLGATIQLFLFPDCGNDVDSCSGSCSHDFPPYTTTPPPLTVGQDDECLFLSVISAGCFVAVRKGIQKDVFFL